MWKYTWLFKIYIFKGSIFNSSFFIAKRIKCLKTFHGVWLRYSMNGEKGLEKNNGGKMKIMENTDLGL